MILKLYDITDLRITALSKRLGMPQLHNNEKTEYVRDTINNSCPETEEIILAETIKQEMDLDLEEEFVQDENCNLDSHKGDRGQSPLEKYPETEKNMSHLIQNSPLFKCDKCQMSFSLKDKLKYHKSLHFSVDQVDKLIKLKMDEKLIKDKLQLIKQQRDKLIKHKKDRHDRRCKYCNKQFATERKFREHRNICHK